MLNVNRRLRRLESAGEPIRVGLIGAGQMGSSLVSLLHGLPGMRVAAVVDIVEERARQSCLRAGVPPDQIVTAGGKGDDPGNFDVIRVASELKSVVHHPAVDVIVEATGVPDVGAQVALAAIAAGKHIVMLNAETDATVGPILARKADAAGVVYTGSAGDEPAAIMELYDFADALGFEILVAGKGKNNPLRHNATPAQLEARAAADHASARMLCSFVDGTKTMVEMTCVANATGLVPDVPGMHGVTAGLDNVTERLRLRSEGGVLRRYGVVEYVNGLAPGVFVMIRTVKPLVLDTLRYLKMGPGPNFILYRPYHLTSLETPISVARTALYGEATIRPAAGSVAETVAVAKKDLSVGEELDGIGGYTVYGQCRVGQNARAEDLLPLGLLVPGARMVRAVRAGTVLTFADVELPSSTIYKLWQEQGRLVWPAVRRRPGNQNGNLAAHQPNTEGTVSHVH